MNLRSFLHKLERNLMQSLELASYYAVYYVFGNNIYSPIKNIGQREGSDLGKIMTGEIQFPSKAAYQR